MDKSFEILDRKNIGKELWDDFVDKSDEAWLWHRFDLQDALATWQDRYDYSFAITEKGLPNNILAIIPAHLSKHRFLGWFSLNTIESLGGPAYKNDLSPRVKKEVNECIYDYLLVLFRKSKIIQQDHHRKKH